MMFPKKNASGRLYSDLNNNHSQFPYSSMLKIHRLLARKQSLRFEVAKNMLLILCKKIKFANNKQQFMKSKKQVLFPKHLKIFEQVGENIKLARKRRKLSTIQVAERADINRATLYQIEKGNPGVSMGAYFNVLRVLGLQDDFLKLAADDELGRKLQDLELLGK